MKVVLDTSILLLPFTDGLDLMGELQRLLGRVEPVVPQSVAQELEHLSQGAGKRARAARGALQMGRTWAIEATDLPGDDGVLEVVRRTQSALCSNDKKLCDEAAKHGALVVTRQGHGLVRR